jgi:hypothetical protein
MFAAPARVVPQAVAVASAEEAVVVPVQAAAVVVAAAGAVVDAVKSGLHLCTVRVGGKKDASANWKFEKWLHE